ncbi:MAG: VIT family protein [Rikenellaceae bacterium]|nr:VIT family protein [Rikenellaceae bacterium]
MNQKKQYTSRANWLRAAVLGANDGILSTTSLVIGIAAAGAPRYAIVLSALAGLVAGSTSMAAGEYVSVCSQTDVEKSDLQRQEMALKVSPEEELEKLAEIYRQRGLSRELARQVALELYRHDALEAHARDELGIHEMTRPRPLQAAFASAASFVAGGIMPLSVALFAPLQGMILIQYLLAIVFLMLTGAAAARLGGCRIGPSVARISFWGTMSMMFTALVGFAFGIHA